LSLTFNWIGTFRSVSRAVIPSIIYRNPQDTKSLQDILLKLREKVYEDYQSRGSPNVIISIYRSETQPIEKQKVEFQQEGRTVRIPVFWLNELRACLLQHPYDETNALRALQQMKQSHSLNPHIFQYGGIFIYSLGAFYWITAKLGLYTLTSDIRFYLSNPEAIARLYALGMQFVGFVAALGVFFLFKFVREWSGKSVALIAVILYPFVPQFMMLSHRLKPHIFCMPFTLLAALFIYRAFYQPTRRNYFLAGLFAGFTIGIVYTTVSWALIIGIGLIWHAFRKEGETGIAWTAIGGLLLGFLLFNPYYLLAPQEPWEELVTLVTTDMRPTLFFSRLAHFVVSPYPSGLGWPIALLACIGMVVGLVQNKHGDRWMLVMTLVSSVVTNIYRGDAYHAATLFVLSTAWAARAIYEGFHWRPRLTGGGLLILTPWILLQPLMFVSLYRASHPGFALGAWIQEHVPLGSRVLYLKVLDHHDRIPFRYWDYNLEARWTSFSINKEALQHDLYDLNLNIGKAPADYLIFLSDEPVPKEFTVHGQHYIRLIRTGRHFRWENPLLRNRLMSLFQQDNYVYGRVK
jgi:hypothetical protein